MFTNERQVLTESFGELVKRRRGDWIRKGGALSEHFEIGFHHRGMEILLGTEPGAMREARLFVFARHTRASQVPRDETAVVPATRIPGFAITVHEPTVFSSLRRLLGLRTVWVDEKRPGWFLLEDSIPLADARQLPPLIADPLQGLCRQAPLGKLSIALTPQIYRIHRRPLLWTADELEEFVSQGLQLLIAALEMPPPLPAVEPEAQLEFLANLLIGPSEARCGVCGDALTDSTVRCVKCQTPHHRECWEYGGGCSVYACGSLRAV